MNTYNLRKNFTAFYSDQEKAIRGKLAFKTKELHWLGTHAPVVILISIHSAFHQAIEGELKMNALLSTIKSHVNGKITILFADRAHLQTMSLHYSGDTCLAFEKCVLDARLLNKRYQSYLDNCQIAYWHQYVFQDTQYSSYINFLEKAYLTNKAFQDLIDCDAEGTYTQVRSEKFLNKNLFIEMAKKDLLEQCASLFVLASKGYRFQFYPGKPYSSVDFVSRHFFCEEKRLNWVDVFLTIEKKTVLNKTN